MKSKPILQVKVNLPMKFVSGNQMGSNGSRRFRPKEYHEYKAYLTQSILDVMDEVKPTITDGVPYYLREVYYYPIPKTLISTKAKLKLFQDGLVYPATRGTLDLDNTAKPTHDALQDALLIDDAQLVTVSASKRYHDSDYYTYVFELYEIEAVTEIEWYD
ncbi:hypothetical protein pwc_17 [Weissella phage PWc]|nr:hypothetical protein pwc_17 [Weissella phage PWc]